MAGKVAIVIVAGRNISALIPQALPDHGLTSLYTVSVLNPICPKGTAVHCSSISSA